MLQSDIPTPLEDVAFLVRSPHRVAALNALAEGPLRRADIRECTGASSSTISRLLREFEARHWVVRDGPHYEATELGQFVATGLAELLTRIETERKLRDVWAWLPTETDDDGITLEMVADAVVTAAEASDPYAPLHRFESLLADTDRFRFVGSDLALLEPCRDLFRKRILGGMSAEIIDPPQVVRYICSTYPDHCAGPLESDSLTVLIHDTPPPYGVSLFDERVGISCHHPETGTIQAFLDTDSADARRWAETTYDSYRCEARPLTDDTVRRIAPAPHSDRPPLE